MFLIHVCIINACLSIIICGPRIVTAKNTSQLQEKPSPCCVFIVQTKTQVNAKSPQSHNLNPTPAKTCIFVE